MIENELRGPYALTDPVIDQEVSQQGPGAYVLEQSSDLVNFRPMYVGRSDTNINNQLHVHVGSYKRFRYEYCASAQSAFEKECDLYHEVRPHDNAVHPRRPSGTPWHCPHCRLSR